MASTFKRKAKAVVVDSNADGASDTTTTASTTSSTSLLGLSGTKAWTGGITLTSSGLRDLDGILGGGQPLGTCIFIEEDRWTRSLASTIVRYWCAEGLSQNQHLMIPTVEGEENDDATAGFGSFSFKDEETHETEYYGPTGPSKEEILLFLHTLPFNLHWEKQQRIQLQLQQQQKGNALNASSSGVIMETLEEDQEDGEDDDDDERNAAKNEEGLKIAWQYRKDVQQKRTGHDGTNSAASSSSSKSSLSSSDIYCHSYDLSRQLISQLEQQRMSTFEELVTMDPLPVCQKDPSSSRSSCGFRLYQGLLDLVQVKLNKQGQGQGRRKVIRLLLYHHNPETLSIALPLLLVQIRLLQLPVVVMVCLQPWTTSSSKSHQHQQTQRQLVNLHRASDVVFQTEGFAARSIYPPPPEFRHLHGLLLVRKISTWTAPTAIGGGGHYTDLTISKRPPANIYGLKRDRRKLNIPLLHIPPEDHTEGGGSVAGGGVRSGAGRPSSSSKKTAAKPGGGVGGGCGSGGGGNSLLDF